MTKTILNLKKRLIIAGAFSAVLLTVFSCGKKEIYNSRVQEDMLRKRSLELENSYVSSGEVNSLPNTFTDEAPVSDAVIPVKNIATSGQTTYAQETFQKVETPKKGRKEVQLMDIKERATKLNVATEVKEVKSVKKSSFIKKVQAINQNVKLGLILLLAGILVSIFGGIFSVLGGIVAIIGIVFLILGLLEM